MGSRSESQNRFSIRELFPQAYERNLSFELVPTHNISSASTTSSHEDLSSVHTSTPKSEQRHGFPIKREHLSCDTVSQSRSPYSPRSSRRARSLSYVKSRRSHRSQSDDSPSYVPPVLCKRTFAPIYDEGPRTSASVCSSPGTRPSPYSSPGTRPSPYSSPGTRPSPYSSPGTRPSPYSSTGTRPSPCSSTGTRSSPCSSPGTRSSPCSSPGTRPSLCSSPDTRTTTRSFFTEHQVACLQRVFANRRYVCSSERQKLAKELNMTDQQVKTWFQNRRMKVKRKRQEQMHQDYISKLAYIHSVANNVKPQRYHDYLGTMYATGYPIMPHSNPFQQPRLGPMAPVFGGEYPGPEFNKLGFPISHCVPLLPFDRPLYNLPPRPLMP
ncbi:homeobox protein pv.1 isoform X2 [Nematostella vectensis]|uniref:homeobox protein pv.1 isoform X2 n=1 Tax=Nematostella vectensis TaxID=45351 RepID=UPI0020776966|nr:homeobox protein pv.1 isoform X2 [Nematostella vectensis]